MQQKEINANVYYNTLYYLENRVEIYEDIIKDIIKSVDPKDQSAIKEIRSRKNSIEELLEDYKEIYKPQKRRRKSSTNNLRSISTKEGESE